MLRSCLCHVVKLLVDSLSVPSLLVSSLPSEFATLFCATNRVSCFLVIVQLVFANVRLCMFSGMSVVFLRAMGNLQSRAMQRPGMVLVFVSAPV